jgi:photosystem II stability/assembly factor-like uncharacterized protein
MLRSVHFPVNAQTGYAAGQFRAVVKTTNGGSTWTIQQFPPGSDNLWSIYFPTDADTGYIAGDPGIYKTTDGGTNWVRQDLTLTNLRSVHFPANAQTGYAAGINLIVKTTNGGVSWVKQDSTHSLSSVHFPVNAQTGYATGGEYNSLKGAILRTTDGGATWTGQNSGSSNYLYSVYFPVDAQTGYVVGESGTILKTTDGGMSFVEDQPSVRPLAGLTGKGLKATPNPFVSYATLPGHEADRFALYDISGRRVGVYRGDRVGEGLSAGVYFLRTEKGERKPLRIVKVR